jgi:hypothetical protein
MMKLDKVIRLTVHHSSCGLVCTQGAGILPSIEKSVALNSGTSESFTEGT